MAGIGTPRPFRAPLELVAKLDDPHAEGLVGALSRARPLARLSDLEEVVRASLPTEQGDQAEVLVAALMSISGRLRTLSMDRMTSTVSTSPDLDLTDQERGILKRRLAAIAGLPAVWSTASAVELLTQNERNYRTARIVTDVRHVFEDDATGRPIGAVIIQVLAIQTWNRDGEEKTVHIAMDDEDLRELESATRRALEKTSNLKGMLTEQQLPYFQLDEREL